MIVGMRRLETAITPGRPAEVSTNLQVYGGFAKRGDGLYTPAEDDLGEDQESAVQSNGRCELYLSSGGRRRR
jgi:hypothetical protein